MSFTYQFNTTCAAVYGVPEAEMCIRDSNDI